MTTSERSESFPRRLAARFRGVPGQPLVRLSLQTRERFLGLLLISPMLLVFLAIIFYPLVYGASRGFYAVQLLTLRSRYLGLENFTQMLSSGSDFYKALWIDVQWAAGQLILQVVLGVAVALFLNHSFPARSIIRGLIIFPFLSPVIVSVLVWKWMFNDVYGIINYASISWGITHGPILWLSSVRWSLLSVILASSWRLFPFMVILVLARLQTIPQQLYDSAKADGASNWLMFWDITLPQLRGVLLVGAFIRFIFEFNDFNFIGLLTGGGPASSTQTLPVLIYGQAFGQQHLGLAAATSDLVLLLEVMFCLIYFWLSRATGER
jgi:multiple sugar transport system permease protein